MRTILNYSIMIRDDGIIVALEHTRKYGGKGWRGKWGMLGEEECRLEEWGSSIVDESSELTEDSDPNFFQYSGETVTLTPSVAPLLEFLTNSSTWLTATKILPPKTVEPSDLSSVVESGSKYMESVVEVVDTINWCDSVGEVVVGTNVAGSFRSLKDAQHNEAGTGTENSKTQAQHFISIESIEIDLYLTSPAMNEKVKVKIEIAVQNLASISRIWVEGEESQGAMVEEVVEEILGGGA